MKQAERISLARARALRARRQRRGVALIIVLAALTVLTVMLTEIQDESSAEFGSALAARDALVAEYAAKSAVNLSRLLIAAEPTIRRPRFVARSGWCLRW
jgi:general secretion pathway protein K